jgi:hypothetical protein
LKCLDWRVPAKKNPSRQVATYDKSKRFDGAGRREVPKSTTGLSSEQVLDLELLEKLTRYYRDTGQQYGDFRFEPGTGNWFFEGSADKEWMI